MMVAVLGALLLTVAVCAGLGARRRGYSRPQAVFARLIFPGMWVA